MSGGSPPAAAPAVDPTARRPFGRTELAVTPICVGTSPLASMPALYGYPVSAERAEATVAAVLDGPVNFLDTSNNYGAGSAERRIGAVLRRRGIPAGFVLATKADADPQTGDFSADRVRRSVAESLDRLGVDHVPLLYLHDPEHHVAFDQAMGPGGAVEALVGLREAGVAGHLGIAGGPIDLLLRFVRTGVFEAVISHNRWTLLDRSAAPLLAEAHDLGVAVVNGAPYGGGMLVKGVDAQPRYAYRTAAEPIRSAVAAMQRACAEAGVPLAAAALQFSLRDPRVAATIVGLSTPGRIAETLALASTAVPAGLWAELDRYAPGPDTWLG